MFETSDTRDWCGHTWRRDAEASDCHTQVWTATGPAGARMVVRDHGGNGSTYVVVFREGRSAGGGPYWTAHRAASACSDRAHEIAVTVRSDARAQDAHGAIVGALARARAARDLARGYGLDTADLDAAVTALERAEKANDPHG